MKIGNTCIRENGHKVNIFKVVDKIKKEIKALIPEIEEDKLLAIMCRCRRRYEGKLHYEEDEARKLDLEQIHNKIFT